jgi:hypothetical protein
MQETGRSYLVSDTISLKVLRNDDRSRKRVPAADANDPVVANQIDAQRPRDFFTIELAKSGLHGDWSEFVSFYSFVQLIVIGFVIIRPFVHSRDMSVESPVRAKRVARNKKSVFLPIVETDASGAEELATS